jgi:hypothetical protein
MQKPTGITVSTLLMAVFLVVGAVTAIIAPMPAMPQTPMSPSALTGLIHIAVIFFTFFGAVCVFFYSKGQNWARWLVMIDCLFTFVNLIHLHKTWQVSPLGGANLTGQGLLAIFLFYYLNTAPIRAWFLLPSTEK